MTDSPRFQMWSVGAGGESLEKLTGRNAPWVRVEGDELPHPVFVQLARAEDGHLICAGLVIGADTAAPRELTARALRIPLAAIIDTIAAAEHREWKDDPGRPWAAPVMAAIKKRLGAAPPGAKRGRPGAKGHSREFYEEVAQRYREALHENPRAPTKALAETYPNYEYATVRYWLRVIRAQYPELLPPHAPGRSVVKEE